MLERLFVRTVARHLEVESPYIAVIAKLLQVMLLEVDYGLKHFIKC